jgi:hypothetical protein
MPSKDDPIADALTAATPKGAFTIRTSVEAEEPFIIYAELNLSFDYNETYDKNSHKINGQPSLIYMGEIYPESAEAPLRLSLIGHGSPDGSDGEIHNGLSGITTARDIVESIEVYVGADE